MSIISRIIVGTDGSEPATRAVEWAAALAAQLGAEVVAVHVFTIDPAKLPGGYAVLPEAEWNRLRENSRKLLNGEWSEPLSRSGIPFRTALEAGSPAGALIEAARRENADLIVVGNRGRGGFRELLGHHLTHYSPVPVTIVPAQQA
ncbi:MAG: universal stress protein [Thiohalocapsa sp.]